MLTLLGALLFVLAPGLSGGSDFGFYAGGTWYALDPDPSAIVLSSHESWQVERLTLVFEGRKYRLEKPMPWGPGRLNALRFQVSPPFPQEKVEDFLEAAIHLPGVEWASPWCTLPNGRNPYVPLPEILVKTSPNVSLKALKHLALEGTRPRHPQVFRLHSQVRQGATWLRQAAELARQPGVEWAHPDFILHRVPKKDLNDPYLPAQWHLNNDGIARGLYGEDIQAFDAWDITLGDRNAIIAIVDTGVNLSHEDLRANLVSGWDIEDDDPDPSPEFSDHGSSTAGVAAGVGDNGIGISGVCPQCRIMPIRLIDSGDETAEQEAAAFDWAADHGAWIISNSWGPPDDFGTVDPLPDVVREAIDRAGTQGRNGLGCVFTWAAGNGHPIDSCDDDGYSSYEHVLSVGAVTNLGEKSNYSEECSSIDIAAPSSGGTRDIATTEWLYYTGDFGGTSSATPVIAGVAGLILSCNPGLTRDEVYDLLERTADKIDAANAAYDGTGHSTKYGFGRVNAFNALLDAGGCPEPPPTPTPKPQPPALQLPFYEDFEGDTTAWERLNGPLWGIGETRLQPFDGRPGPSVAATRLNDDYREDLLEAVLLSPPLSLEDTGKPMLRFWSWWDCEATSNTYGYDGGVIEASTDFAYWDQLEPEGGYPTSHVAANGWYPGFSRGSRPAWTQVDVDLRGYKGQTVRLRWNFLTDGSDNDYPGWAIDGVEVYDANTTAPRPDPTAPPERVGLGLPFREDFEEDLGDDWFVNGTPLWKMDLQRLFPGAHGGTRYAGTGAGRTYEVNRANAYIVTPLLNLAGYSEATLEFWHWYQAEGEGDAYDGGRVELSIDGGATFFPIQPVGGYPTQSVGSLDNLPGYSYSANPSWQKVQFNLTPFVGRQARIRFHFASDRTQADFPGWFLDDLSVIGVPNSTPMPPKVLLAGYWDTRLTQSEGGTMVLLALIDGGGQAVQEVHLGYEGSDTGLRLYDDGSHNDFASGDGVWGMSFPFQTPLPAVRVSLEIQGVGAGREEGEVWPYLNVE